jgi:DNA-binding NarL/FixJ family response regulator
MDMAMPGMGGIEATRRIVSESPGTRVLILSQHDNERYILPALQAGALGYVIKRAVGDELMNAIRSVHRGQPHLGPAIERMVLRDYQQRTEPTNDPAEEAYGLTERQKQILKLVAEGKTSEEIAGLLHLSAKTVRTHRANIYNRVGTSNLAVLIRLAIRLGLADL